MFSTKDGESNQPDDKNVSFMCFLKLLFINSLNRFS
jgi:hypothetical protein